jgi:23S rRNA U2552 (ribose-2'-O)-methylase RlmE/FtsJ
MYVSQFLQTKLDKTKKLIDNHHNWMYCVKNQFEYEKISNFDRTKRASRAFYKMMELLRNNSLVDPTKTRRALCLCEAPGGFIQAIQEINSDIDVFAQSVDFGIRFSNSINSGMYEYSDLYKLETVMKFIKMAKDNKYDLITADGGIDVSDDYSLQEPKNLRVIYCQILTTMYCLKIGGNFVIKVFDCFTEETVKLLQLLHSSFEHFEIVKPVLSRPCNSEKYVVCRGFKGYSQIPGFIQQIGKDVITFEGIQITKEFTSFILLMNKKFVSRQVRNIEEILDICRGKYNSKNINSARNQFSKSSTMYKSLGLL